MVESRKMKIGVIALLAAIILAIGLLGLSCVRGVSPVGWSGGTVANNVLYVGSNQGRLMAYNFSDNSTQWAEALKVQATGGLFGCSGGGGCGGGTPAVQIYGSPVVSDNLVYIAGYNGKIYAYNAGNLATRWVYPRDSYLQQLVGGLVVADGKLFIGCSDGKVISLDALTGDKLAEYKTGDKIWGTPAVVDGVLYIGSFDKYLYALNAADLTLKWKYNTAGSIISTPLVDNGTVYFGSFDKNLYALNTADGTLKWKFTGDKWFWAQPKIIDGTIYAGCLDNYVYVLDAANGTQITKFNLNSPVASTPVVSGNYIVFASHNGLIFKIDLTTREIKQVDDLKINVDGPLTAYQGVVYIHPQEIVLFRINIDNDAILPAISLQS
ncbi:MAG: PQQ-binding-like beta-propeller repeat protein [Dehalococcoidales bacterium]|jgi:outer membrane protein assembly factor BamB